MIEGFTLRPDDRVLLLSIPEPAVVAEMAARLTAGILVGLGGDEEVRAARRAARDLENVMFVPAPLEEIPWRDGFFTKVIDWRGAWANPEQVAREVARVLASGGEVYLADPACRAVFERIR
ncbi:MAG: methyltransferase domain-containing protein [Bryobacterales bacterium]|nr:class I SAM-dependent methyltransferase [Bryobacteraceae bacterium]MDW8355462.1 methyltransferase domain-containing protein [Bryobacterales bacterium]